MNENKIEEMKNQINELKN